MSSSNVFSRGNTYFDLIDTTFEFPQEGIEVRDGILYFYGVNLMSVIDRYGTPLRLFYLPRISQQIEKARTWFNRAFRRFGYTGKYIYSYCTKSNHFAFVLWEVLKNGVDIEVSHTNDLYIVEWLWANGWIDRDIMIIANGYKEREYVSKLIDLVRRGFTNVVSVLDNTEELKYYKECDVPIKIGLRIAAEEEPTFEFYTSRLGIRPDDIVDFYKREIKGNRNMKVVMLHFFINTGIQDSPYYWSEFRKALEIYVKLKKECPTLRMFNVGGGFPVRNSLRFDYDYEEIISEMVEQIHKECLKEGIPEPDIVTEFGTFTVGESGAHIFRVLGEKVQNDAEHWYMLDGSIMNFIPDTWGLGERFIVLPVNHWYKPYQRVNLGGLSCDAHDYYNSEVHLNHVFLPVIEGSDEPLYVAFLHTGAYQDNLSGYGGLQHCLIPSPRYVVLYEDEKGGIKEWLFSERTSPERMLELLGYNSSQNVLPSPVKRLVDVSS